MTHVRIYAQTRSLGKEEQQIVLFGLRRRNNEFLEFSNFFQIALAKFVQIANRKTIISIRFLC